jgi:hypothetical protein
MNKKGSYGWIFILVGVIIIAGIIVAIIISNQDKTTVPIITNQSLNLYIRALEPNTKISISGNYIVNDFYTNYVLSRGELIRDSFTLIEGITTNKTEIYCASDNHYSNLSTEEFTQEEKNNNLSKQECTLNKIGKLKIESSPNLVEGDNTITLNVSAIGLINRPSFCMSWSPNIVLINNLDSGLICNNAIWLNYTSYNQEKKEFHWLPKDIYRCGDWMEECESVEGTICHQVLLDVPARYKDKVSKCYRIAEQINNENKIVRLQVKAENINSADAIQIYLFDEDLWYNENTGKYEYISELNNKNLGTKEDIIYEIK